MRIKSTVVRLLGASMLMAAVTPFVGGSSATAANPSEDCPDGTTAVAKYEWKGSGYVAEFGGDVVTVTGDTTAGTFTSTVPISAVFVKGAQDGKTDLYDPPVLSGTFASSGLSNPGGTPAISHVTFCTGGPSTPATTSSAPVTTTSSAPVTTTSSAPVTTTSSAPVTTTSGAPVTTTSGAPVSVLPTQTTASEAEETDVAVEGTKSGGGGELAETGAGLPLGTALAVSLGLLLAGAALMFVPRHLAVARGTHRRRH
jgi:hypothetical protein